MNPEDVLTVRNVRHDFVRSGQIFTVLQMLSFSVQRGSFVGVVGPSGGGKSTLFNIIAGLLKPTSGEVWVDGDRVSAPTGHVGYMLQKDLLLPWRTILENVTLGFDATGVPRRQGLAEAHAFLERFGLAGFEKAYPRELSGGMRQRVALIRTLVTGPSIILLDEPFSAVDYQTRIMLEAELLRINRESGVTMLLITHDIGEAVSLSNQVVVLSKRPATVKAVHDIHLTLDGPHTPVNARSAPEYNEYFRTIWDELDIQSEAGVVV